MIELANVSARARAERGKARAVLREVSLVHRGGIHAVIGTVKDGSALLHDLLDGTEAPSRGRVAVLGGLPDAARAKVARVSLDAPLPEALRVDEVCDLAADLRGEPRRPAKERLDVLGIANLGARRVRSLERGERKAVTLAIALTSQATVLLLEEPFLLEHVAPRLVLDALHARAREASILATTASPRDAARLGGSLGILVNGAYAAIDGDVATGARATVRVVVANGAANMFVGALTGADAVTRLETSTYAGDATLVVVSGEDLARLSRSITAAIASSRVDVERIEPVLLGQDAIAAALGARTAGAAS